MPTPEELEAQYQQTLAKLNDPSYIKELNDKMNPPEVKFEETEPQMPEVGDDLSPKEIAELILKFQKDLTDYHRRKDEFYKGKDKEQFKKSLEKEAREKELASIAAFAEKHPDFEELKQDIAKYYNQGVPLKDAYRLAKLDKGEVEKKANEEKVIRRPSARQVTSADIESLRPNVKTFKDAAKIAVDMFDRS